MSLSVGKGLVNVHRISNVASDRASMNFVTTGTLEEFVVSTSFSGSFYIPQAVCLRT